MSDLLTALTEAGVSIWLDDLSWEHLTEQLEAPLQNRRGSPQ